VPLFEHSEYLLGILLLLPLVALFLYVLKQKKRIRKILGDEERINQLTADYSAKKYNLKFYFSLAALLLLLIAIANPRIKSAVKDVSRQGVDIVVALDVSKSMLSNDIKPTRLDRSKQLINQLIDKAGSNRIGFVVFAGQAYIQMPVTGDFGAAKMYVANASPDAVSMQGTSIGDALKTAQLALDTKEKKYKAIVLITDGEDHEAAAIEQAEKLSENGVKVFTVGSGTTSGSTIIEAGTNAYKVDKDGNTVISKLNETLLQQIAASGNGKYYLLSNPTTIAKDIMQQIDGMEKRTVNATTATNYQSLYMILVFAALVLLVLEYFITERKTKRLLW